MNTSSNKPSLSIILVTKNRVKILRRSLESIIREVEADFPEAEIIVIDGGSTDGTVDILNQYSNRLAYWVSEPDSGVAEAANKGIAHAQADVIRLIGDDDELIPGRLRVMMEILSKLPEIDILAGHNKVYIEGFDGHHKAVVQPRFRGEVSRDDMYQWGMEHGIIIPEVCFFRKRAVEEHHGYDQSLKWWGFLDLFLRMLNSGNRLYVIPIDVLITYQTPSSDTYSNLTNSKFWDEFNLVMSRHQGIKWRVRRYINSDHSAGDITYRYLRVLGRATGIHPRLIIKKIWKYLGAASRDAKQ